MTIKMLVIFFQSLTEDVNRQMERERELQKRYQHYQTQKEYYLNT